MGKAITVYKACLVYAVKIGKIAYDDTALDDLTVADADDMPEAEGCTFEQYLTRCKIAGIEVFHD